MPTRNDFDATLTTTSAYPCLSKLARDIATINWTQALTYGLDCTASIRPNYNYQPLNLLANAPLSSPWSGPNSIGPAPINACTLAGWKAKSSTSQYGFEGSSCTGLSYMFDPWVDATLYAHVKYCQKTGKTPFQQTKVIVLTDYSDVTTVIDELNTLPKMDWAENQIRSFFCQSQKATGDRLRAALLNKTGANAKEIFDGFGKNNLLIWNFSPFLRGKDAKGTGFQYVPYLKKPSCITLCLRLLTDFQKCVNACGTLIACCEELRDNSLIKGRRIRHPSCWRHKTEYQDFRDFLK